MIRIERALSGAASRGHCRSPLERRSTSASHGTVSNLNEVGCLAHFEIEARTITSKARIRSFLDGGRDEAQLCVDEHDAMWLTCTVALCWHVDAEAFREILATREALPRRSSRSEIVRGAWSIAASRAVRLGKCPAARHRGRRSTGVADNARPAGFVSLATLRMVPVSTGMSRN